MCYSLVGISALMICLIINKDIIFKRIKSLPKAYKIYELFLFSIMLFFISDSIWGLLDEYHLIGLLYADTIIFFVIMTLSVVLWTLFVGKYINRSKRLNLMLYIGGFIILLFSIIMVIINFIKPIMFSFEGNDYKVYTTRYILFCLQIILYLSVSIASLVLFIRDKKNKIRYRYLSICLSSAVMASSIIGQTFFPLLPVYSIGSIISICLIHIFVVGSEKDEVLMQLEDSINRERNQKKELDLTKTLVYLDSLTGAKSKHAFQEIEEKIDELIKNKKIYNFSIVVFDINDLKYINDTKGHEYGDIYIKDSYKIITDVFNKSEVYRFGGDEFVSVLLDDDFINRDKLFDNFNDIINNNLENGKPVVSIGIADFDQYNDDSFNSVFIRADKKMYDRKKYLKALRLNRYNKARMV